MNYNIKIIHCIQYRDDYSPCHNDVLVLSHPLILRIINFFGNKNNRFYITIKNCVVL